MATDERTTPGDTLRWELSPADLRYGSLLVYLPVAVLGGHVGLVLVTGVALLPAMLADLRLLALATLLVLVGGPFSLVYLWPMLRDPEQRPAVARDGWLAHASAPGVVVATVLGTALLVGASRVGPRTRLTVTVGFVVVPLALLGLFVTEGRLDSDAGTLTVRERTVDARSLAGVQCVRVGGVAVCRLAYVEGAGGFGRPYVVALPEAVADDVLATLERGVAADADPDTRESDPVAVAVLAVVAALFFVTAGGAVRLLGRSGVLLALVAGGLGCVFALGAYYVA